MFTCGIGLGPEFPEVGDGICCMGAALRGPDNCTCWVAIYDLDQAELDPSPFRRRVRDEPCGDCAYRPDSPERQGDETVEGDAELLERLTYGDVPFFCHDGIRRVLRWEHHPADGPPSGAIFPGNPADYTPIIVEGVPYRADGQPAFICAGWAARRALR